MKAIDRLPQAARGAVYMLLSTLVFGVLWVLIRLISDDMPPHLIVFWRTLFGLAVMAPALLRSGRALLRTRKVNLHLLRATTGLFAMYTTFYAVATAPLADVVAISYATPLFVTLTAVLFLNEVIRTRRIAALAVGIAGMLIVMRPGFRELGPGHLAALAAALFTAGSLTVIKLLSATDSTEAIVGYPFLIALPVTFAIALLFWQWPTGFELLTLVAIGALANLGQTFMARSFAAADVTAVLPIDLVRLVLAAGFGYALFGEGLDWQTVVGATVILVSTVYLAHREARAGRVPPPGPPQH